MNRILQAAAFARQAHMGQVRKYTKEPYVHHPARVAARVSLLPWATEDMVVAAYLHDTIEDCKVTMSDLVEAFGQPVADLVHELTDAYTSEQWPNLNRQARKTLELERLLKASVQAKAIKLADIYDNLLGTDPSDSFADVFLGEKETLVRRFRSELPVEEIGRLIELLEEVNRAAFELEGKRFDASRGIPEIG